MRIIGHGVDLVDVGRIEQMLRDHGRRFIERVFTEREQRYAESARRRRGERYAARFACKEAVLKALGTGWRDGIGWRDIEVTHGLLGEPRLHLSGRCARVQSDLGIETWHVSLSHISQLALASVVGCGPDSSGDAPSSDRH